MDLSLALVALDGCSGSLGGLALLLVGLIVLRPVHAASGFLVGGAGACKVLLNCCYSLPVAHLHLTQSFDALATLEVIVVVVHLLRLIAFVLLATAAVLAAKELRSRALSPREPT